MAEPATEPDERQPAPADSDAAHRAIAVDRCVRRHTFYGAATGLIPLPVVDALASTASQVHMIAELCELYRLPFSEQAVKAVIAALIGSGLPQATFAPTALSAIRAVPVAGPLLGLAAIPAGNALVSWALGRVFAWHFANGGTLETFDPEAASTRLHEEYRRAKSTIAARLHVTARRRTDAAAST